MKSFLLLATTIAMLLMPAFAFAADGLPDAFDDDPAPKFLLVEAEAFTGLSTRLDELEAKVDTKVTAEQARAIAIEEIEKVMVTLRGADGKVKQQAVPVQQEPVPDSAPNAQRCDGPNCQCVDCQGPECDGAQCSTGSFQVQPGEQIIGYTDPTTGQYVDLTRQDPQRNCTTTYDAYGRAVTTCSQGNVQYTQQQPAANQPAQASFQVRGGPLRRLFGGRR